MTEAGSTNNRQTTDGASTDETATDAATINNTTSTKKKTTDKPTHIIKEPASNTELSNNDSFLTSHAAPITPSTSRSKNYSGVTTNDKETNSGDMARLGSNDQVGQSPVNLMREIFNPKNTVRNVLTIPLPSKKGMLQIDTWDKLQKLNTKKNAVILKHCISRSQIRAISQNPNIEYSPMMKGLNFWMAFLSDIRSMSEKHLKKNDCIR